MKHKYKLDINVKELKLQIKAVLESNMPERFKTGVHNLLGEILDIEEESRNMDTDQLFMQNVKEMISDIRKHIQKPETLREILSEFQDNNIDYFESFSDSN